MHGVTCAVLNVGGWFDAEDPIGPFHIYRAVGEDPGRHESAGHGPVVARRLVARRRGPPWQRRFRGQDGGLLPGGDPVPFLHAPSQGHAGEPPRSPDVSDRPQRVAPPGRVAAEEPQPMTLYFEAAEGWRDGAGRAAALRRVCQRPEQAGALPRLHGPAALPMTT